MIKVEILKALPGYTVGQSVQIEVDADGVAIDRYWRKRIRDSKIDGCLKLADQKPKKASKAASKEALTLTDSGEQND